MSQAITWYTLATLLAIQCPPWEASQFIHEEFTTAVLNRSATLCCGLSSPFQQLFKATTKPFTISFKNTHKPNGVILYLNRSTRFSSPTITPLLSTRIHPGVFQPSRFGPRGEWGRNRGFIVYVWRMDIWGRTHVAISPTSSCCPTAAWHLFTSIHNLFVYSQTTVWVTFSHQPQPPVYYYLAMLSVILTRLGTQSFSCF